MHAPLLSPDWYRIAFLRPRLRAGVRIAHQQVRGETWTVATDPVSGRHHRFNRTAWRLVARCDGQHTLDEVWAAAVEEAGDAAPTQAEAIAVVSQAFSGHLLLGDLPPDADAVVRAQSRRRTRRRRQAVNPLALRVPLWDPDAFLARHVHRVRRVFDARVLRVAALLLAVTLLALLAHAAPLARDARLLLADARGWLLLWLAYPLVKGLHELAHAFAVKHFGGDVRRTGIALLMLTPAPYVDASASASFPDKRARALVAAAGIATELLLAGLALVAWLALEPGLPREIATAIVLIGGLSTLLVNGNPLLRFDGYHVLCDLAELPNLALRSRAYGLHLLQRHVLRLPNASFGLARGERPWLLAYAPLAWALRMALMAALALSLAREWPWVAVVLALATLWLGVLQPLWQGLRWAVAAPQLASRRPRALALVLAGFGAAGVLAFVLPLPHASRAPGIVQLPDEALVRLQVGGFVEEYLVRDGDAVQPGQPLARLSNEPLAAALAKARADLTQAEVLRAQLRESDPLAAAQALDRIAQLRGEVQTLERQQDALVVRAGAAGRVAFDVHRDLVGLYVRQGHLLAQVVPDAAPRVRALVDNSDIALVRERTAGASVALASGGPALPARVHATVPLATTTLPSAALGAAAGGSIALDPADPSGLTAREPRFAVDLSLPAHARPPIGARVMVTFDHGETHGTEWLVRLVRRSLLRHLPA